MKNKILEKSRESRKKHYTTPTVVFTSVPPEKIMIEHYTFMHSLRNDAFKVHVTNAFGILEKIDRRKAWINALSIQKPITHSMCVCSLHFQASDHLAKGKTTFCAKSLYFLIFIP